MSIDIALQQKVSKFAQGFNISRKVKLGLSKLVTVPCMAGYFKPVILLPFTLSGYLSAAEIEAILLHELAHIKRNDYFINLLQQVVTILLFFNPCILLINKIINNERENCCDDLVIRTTSNPLIYAKALLKLEQTRQNHLQLAMAAIGKKYQLLNRIERIMKTKNETPSLRPALLAMLILTIGIASMALLNPQIAQGKISVKAITPVIKNLIADTTPKTKVKKPVKPLAAKADTLHGKVVNHYSVTKADKNPTHNKVVVTRDKKLDELNAAIKVHSEAVAKYYQSEAFKATEAGLQQKAKEIQQLYNNPELKNLQEEITRASAGFQKNLGNNDELKQLSAQMEDMGKNLGAYYSSPEFKKMNEELEKKYGIAHNYTYNEKDENYKKYQAELEARIPPEIKKQQDELKTMGQQMRQRYESPQFKAQSQRLKALGDSMKQAYNNPQLKAQQKAMEKLGEEMKGFENSPELKKERELLRQAVEKMTAYIHSAEYTKYINGLKNYRFNFEYNDNTSPEKPERPEKPEHPEKPEQNN